VSILRQRVTLTAAVGYWVLLFLAMCLTGVPLAVITYYWRGDHWTAAGWAVGALLSGIPIDKTLLDGRYRKLAKIERDEGTL
jgi:hypothetical protein